MGHGGYILGAEHGGWLLEGGLTWGVLAALTGVRDRIAILLPIACCVCGIGAVV